MTAQPLDSTHRPSATGVPPWDAVRAADLETARALADALRERLGATGQQLLDRFDDLHRHDRMLTEVGRDLEARASDLERRRAAVAVLERLVDERRERLMAEILVIETMRQAAAAYPPPPRT